MDVVVGLIKNKDGHILVARRGPHQSHPQKLEFPGGKIDPDEPPFAALVRELHEELGITVKKATFVLEVPFEYQREGSVILHVWVVDAYEGEPYGAEDQEVFWVPLSKINNADFLHANTVIIDYLLGEGS